MAEQNSQIQTQVNSTAQYLSKMAEVVTSEVSEKMKKGLIVPEGYNLQNSVTLALFQIKNTVDRDKVPVISSCTADSVKQALVEMITKGLDPNKKHCYWIPYGKTLSCTESYFGLQHRMKRADKNIRDVFAEIVYDNDTFTYIIKHGTKVVTDHLQSPENVDISKIRGAYCTVLYRDGEEVSEYMTIQQIRNSWTKSQTKGESDAHRLFPEQMCKRTVTKRLCNSILNRETNDILLMDEENIDNNADENEATETIDITPVENIQVKEEPKEQPKKIEHTADNNAQLDLTEIPQL